MTHARKLALSALALALLGAAASQAAPAALKPEPRKVKGVVLDTRGRPVEGATVWVLPAVTTGVVILKTNAQGQYATGPLPVVPYRTYARVKVPYRGQNYCLRAAAENEAQYDHFTPENGVIRNFRLKLTGPVPDAGYDNAFFGGEVRIMHHTWEGTSIVDFDSTVEVTLVPNGPLVDGSTGKTLVKRAKVGENFLYDIPIGHYDVTAVEIRKDGTRTPLVMGEYLGPPRAKTTLAFKPMSSSTCGGPGGGHDVERAFLYVSRPSN